VSKDAIWIAVCESHEIEQAVEELERASFEMKRLSVVGRDYHAVEHAGGYYEAGGRMHYLGQLGAFWNSIWELLSGAAFFAVPEIGPVLVAGPLVDCIANTLRRAAALGGHSVIGASLYGIGIPRDQVIRYEVALRANKFLLIGQGTAEKMARAGEIVRRTAPVELHVYAGAKTASAGSRAKTTHS
jgi:hypothetical protein